MMNIIERKDIDINQWNNLVANTENASFFSYSWYLDAVAENWCVLVDADYSYGIALPYLSQLGIKTIYTPVFIRFLEILGADYDKNEFKSLILEHFNNIQFACKQNIFGDDSQEFIYQVIGCNDDRVLGSQAKRSLKKAEKLGFKTVTSLEQKEVLKVIHQELNGKFEGINNRSLANLEKLITNAEVEKKLKVFSLEQEGGIFCLENKSQLLYLKGTVKEECKKNGGMYLLLNDAIDYAQKNGLQFDFGGSRIEGVRRFNLNLGGKDQVYFQYSKEDYPIWYRFLKKIKQAIKK